MIDFFIRHGITSADNERDSAEINMRLHRTLPFRHSTLTVTYTKPMSIARFRAADADAVL